MIRIKTINIDGKEIERTFESVADILTNWWDENGTDLPGGDDDVLELTMDGKSIRSIRHFAELIQELESLFWRGVSTIKKMEDREQVKNQESLEDCSHRITEFCPHCNEEVKIELMADFEEGRKSKERTLIRFPERTDREEIWKWYDRNHPKGITYLLYGEDRSFLYTLKSKGN